MFYFFTWPKLQVMFCNSQKVLKKGLVGFSSPRKTFVFIRSVIYFFCLDITVEKYSIMVHIFRQLYLLCFNSCLDSRQLQLVPSLFFFNYRLLYFLVLVEIQMQSTCFILAAGHVNAQVANHTPINVNNTLVNSLNRNCKKY